MGFIRDALIVPQVEAFRPDAVVLLCGADGVEEDPLAHLSMSNNAHWAVVSALMGMAPRFLVLGGGGYNPWSFGRLCTGVCATRNGQTISSRLPAAAAVVGRVTPLGATTMAAGMMAGAMMAAVAPPQPAHSPNRPRRRRSILSPRCLPNLMG